jgi:pimeloyl-ACP methyl ester carboxylesterase
MAYELHELLNKEKIDPPYVLVGHSMGGFVIRCFANMYPNQVAGLVFIDGACELDFKKGIEMRNEADKIKFRRGFDSLINVPSRPKGINDESKHLFDFDKDDFSSNSNIVKRLKIPDNVPITIYVSTQLETDNPYSKREKEVRFSFFKSWKNQAPQIKLIETSKSGHCIQCDEPNLIADGIKDMLKEIKKGK